MRLHASSLNFHDLGVVTGQLRSAGGRIPMSDGAGVVKGEGEGGTEFAAGDGYARESINRPAHWFTRAPAGYSHAKAATLTTAGLTARHALVVDGGLKAGDVVLVLGTGGVSTFALQIAVAMEARVVVTS